MFVLTPNQQHVLERLVDDGWKRPSEIKDTVTDYGAVSRALDSLYTWRMVESELYAQNGKGQSSLYHITAKGRRELAFATNGQPNEHGFMLRPASSSSWQVNLRAPFAQYLEQQGYHQETSSGIGEDVRWVNGDVIIIATANNCLTVKGRAAKQARTMLAELAQITEDMELNVD